jgi:ComF family protein
MENGKISFHDFLSPFSILQNSFLTLVYPQACRICEESVESANDGFVCDKCWRRTRIFKNKEILCCKCGSFLKNGTPIIETFCHRCETDEYDFARAVGLYENALSVSVLNLKKEPFIPKRLQDLLLSAFKNAPFQDTTCIIPVPLSKRRQLERGYNQAAVIAESVSKQSGIPLDKLSLMRTVHTDKHRAGMDRKARTESVKNAFEVKRPRLIESKNILLIDDIFTSGATVSNCAKALKKSGAGKVYVLTLARAF